jgi:hypothetical protein
MCIPSESIVGPLYMKPKRFHLSSLDMGGDYYEELFCKLWETRTDNAGTSPW